MVLPVIAAAVAARPTSDCTPDLAAGEVVIERRPLAAKYDRLEAVSVSESNSDVPWTRVMVLAGDCKVIFERRFKWAEQARFSEGLLGHQPFLLVTTFQPGGSGCGYDHIILAYGRDNFRKDELKPLAPAPLGHDNMDGLFVGDLGRGRGPGLVTWSAQWNGGGHYSRHPYKIVAYRWRDGRFIGPAVRTTTRKYDPSPDNVASRLGFSFRDLTQQARFGGC